MTQAIQRKTEASIMKEIKKEIVYEYHPIIGKILGIWRKQNVTQLGTEINLHLDCTLEDFDRILINGKQIEWKYIK